MQNRLEPFELGRAHDGAFAFALARILVRISELLGLGPGLEIFATVPDHMTGIKRVLVV